MASVRRNCAGAAAPFDNPVMSTGEVGIALLAIEDARICDGLPAPCTPLPPAMMVPAKLAKGTTRKLFEWRFQFGRGSATLNVPWPGLRCPVTTPQCLAHGITPNCAYSAELVGRGSATE